MSSSDWYNGNLARFGLLTPETDYREHPTPQNSIAPHALAERLQRLHERLPEPPVPNAIGEKQSAEAWSLSADFWSACHTYEQALRAMTAPHSALLTAQEARGLSAAVTLGSATNNLAPRWLSELVNRRLLLVAYDTGFRSH